jgi:hypothetical protein
MKTNSICYQLARSSASSGATGFVGGGLPFVTHLKFLAVLTLFLGSCLNALASDPIGIYALVDKVVFEPNEKAPERIQVWGAFAIAEGYGVTYDKAQRGYLYYKLNEKKPEVCRKEWADLKSVAGTGQIVGFGSRYEEKGSLRQTDAKPEKPDAYPLGFGMTKVAKRDYKPINELLALHNSKSAGDGEKKSKKE